jgi:Tfp pilus assembly ATPase PilU
VRQFRNAGHIRRHAIISGIDQQHRLGVGMFPDRRRHRLLSDIHCNLQLRVHHRLNKHRPGAGKNQATHHRPVNITRYDDFFARPTVDRIMA